MKYVRIVLLFIFSVPCFAIREASYDDLALKSMPSDLINKVVKSLNDSQLRPVFLNQKASELLKINLFFSDAFLTSKLIIKFDTKGSYQLHKTYKVAKGYLTHIKIQNIEAALYFENINLQKRQKIITSLKKEVAIIKLPSFFSRAHANDLCPSIAPAVNVNADSQVAEQAQGSALASCMSGLGQGAYDSSFGIWNSLKAEATTLWNQPSQRISEYWDLVGEGAHTLMKFSSVLGGVMIGSPKAVVEMKKSFGEIGAFFLESLNNINEMSTSQKAEMICTILGSLGPDVLLIAISAGASGAKLPLTLTKLLNKMKRLTLLMKKGIKLPLRYLQDLGPIEIRKLQIIIDDNHLDLLNKKLKDIGCAV